MESNNPYEILDDDDGFDWEAAAGEIDAVCYFRWFPEEKIVFAAPSRPLVMQQIEACHNIFCEAVRELMVVPVQLRILALTTTPGSKKETVQDVIDNLQISKIEHRSETEHDILPYVHDRKIELI
ncbi:hypothetical protein KIW84_042053 [Lathyrus oleraceus]|uniref:Uncharacterized protein n=1 Tax=Pisum sativum TaxID=3888 RepID=A0A9D4XEC5_PEA|nr:hypothetical protein KIW84_042053 [Pisum sativum]